MKAARGILILSLTMVLCLGVMGTGIAARGYGNGYGNSYSNANSNANGNGVGGGSGLGSGSGACIASDLLTAESVTYTGVVSEVCNYGQGIEIDTNDGENDIMLTIYGIGPVRYWEEELGEARPDVGEEITVTGKTVTFLDGTTKFIAFEITIDGEDTITLRDPDTGLPLWRGEGSMFRHRYMQ